MPATKLAHREGARVILDPFWQNVASDLFEHIDQVRCPFPQPGMGSQVQLLRHPAPEKHIMERHLLPERFGRRTGSMH